MGILTSSFQHFLKLKTELPRSCRHMAKDFYHKLATFQTKASQSTDRQQRWQTLLETAQTAKPNIAVLLEKTLAFDGLSSERLLLMYRYEIPELLSLSDFFIATLRKKNRRIQQLQQLQTELKETSLKIMECLYHRAWAYGLLKEHQDILPECVLSNSFDDSLVTADCIVSAETKTPEEILPSHGFAKHIRSAFQVEYDKLGCPFGVLPSHFVQLAIQQTSAQLALPKTILDASKTKALPPQKNTPPSNPKEKFHNLKKRLKKIGLFSSMGTLILAASASAFVYFFFGGHLIAASVGSIAFFVFTVMAIGTLIQKWRAFWRGDRLRRALQQEAFLPIHNIEARFLMDFNEIQLDLVHCDIVAWNKRFKSIDALLHALQRRILRMMPWRIGSWRKAYRADLVGIQEQFKTLSALIISRRHKLAEQIAFGISAAVKSQYALTDSQDCIFKSALSQHQKKELRQFLVDYGTAEQVQCFDDAFVHFKKFIKTFIETPLETAATTRNFETPYLMPFGTHAPQKELPMIESELLAHDSDHQAHIKTLFAWLQHHQIPTLNDIDAYCKFLNIDGLAIAIKSYLFKTYLLTAKNKHENQQFSLHFDEKSHFILSLCKEESDYKACILRLFEDHQTEIKRAITLFQMLCKPDEKTYRGSGMMIDLGDGVPFELNDATLQQTYQWMAFVLFYQSLTGTVLIEYHNYIGELLGFFQTRFSGKNLGLIQFLSLLPDEYHESILTDTLQKRLAFACQHFDTHALQLTNDTDSEARALVSFSDLQQGDYVTAFLSTEEMAFYDQMLGSIAISNPTHIERVFLDVFENNERVLPFGFQEYLGFMSERGVIAPEALDVMLLFHPHIRSTHLEWRAAKKRVGALIRECQALGYDLNFKTTPQAAFSLLLKYRQKSELHLVFDRMQKLICSHDPECVKRGALLVSRVEPQAHREFVRYLAPHMAKAPYDATAALKKLPTLTLELIQDPEFRIPVDSWMALLQAYPHHARDILFRIFVDACHVQQNDLPQYIRNFYKVSKAHEKEHFCRKMLEMHCRYLPATVLSKIAAAYPAHFELIGNLCKTHTHYTRYLTACMSATPLQHAVHQAAQNQLLHINPRECVPAARIEFYGALTQLAPTHPQAQLLLKQNVFQNVMQHYDPKSKYRQRFSALTDANAVVDFSKEQALVPYDSSLSPLQQVQRFGFSYLRATGVIPSGLFTKKAHEETLLNQAVANGMGNDHAAFLHAEILSLIDKTSHLLNDVKARVANTHLKHLNQRCDELLQAIRLVKDTVLDRGATHDVLHRHYHDMRTLFEEAEHYAKSAQKITAVETPARALPAQQKLLEPACAVTTETVNPMKRTEVLRHIEYAFIQHGIFKSHVGDFSLHQFLKLWNAEEGHTLAVSYRGYLERIARQLLDASSLQTLGLSANATDRRYASHMNPPLFGQLYSLAAMSALHCLDCKRFSQGAAQQKEADHYLNQIEAFLNVLEEALEREKANPQALMNQITCMWHVYGFAKDTLPETLSGLRVLFTMADLSVSQQNNLYLFTPNEIKDWLKHTLHISALKKHFGNALHARSVLHSIYERLCLQVSNPQSSLSLTELIQCQEELRFYFEYYYCYSKTRTVTFSENVSEMHRLLFLLDNHLNLAIWLMSEPATRFGIHMSRKHYRTTLETLAEEKRVFPEYMDMISGLTPVHTKNKIVTYSYLSMPEYFRQKEKIIDPMLAFMRMGNDKSRNYQRGWRLEFYL